MHLDASQNELTAIAMVSLASYLSNYESSSELQSLVLDKNELHNDGIRELIDGVIERFNYIEKQKAHGQTSYSK